MKGSSPVLTYIKFVIKFQKDLGNLLDTQSQLPLTVPTTCFCFCCPPDTLRYLDTDF